MDVKIRQGCSSQSLGVCNLDKSYFGGLTYFCVIFLGLCQICTIFVDVAKSELVVGHSIFVFSNNLESIKNEEISTRH